MCSHTNLVKMGYPRDAKHFVHYTVDISIIISDLLFF